MARTPGYDAVPPLDGDRLDGSAGCDVRSLTGSDRFNLNTVKQLAGFGEVRLTNTTSSQASPTLRDGGDLTLTLTGDGTAPPTSGFPCSAFPGGIGVTLGAGLVALCGGNGSEIISASATVREAPEQRVGGWPSS